VLFGEMRGYLDDLGNNHNFVWNITNGQVEGFAKFATRPGPAININSFSGMIGVPEQTEEGVTVVCLLDPSVRWTSHIKLNNAEVARFVRNVPGSSAIVPQSVTFSGEVPIIPPLNPDGDYVCIYAQHTGDTRGNEWYTKLICISIDPSAQLPKALPAPVPPVTRG
jgi:hypothetical protein